MKLLILSDLHLNTTEIIHYDDDLFNYFMKYLNRNYIIVLVGDILDIIKNEYVKHKREYLALKGLYPKTINLIEANKNIIYIKGNHDAMLPKYNSKILDYFNLKINNITLHFEHGHIYDLPNGKCHYVGDTVSCCWGCCKNSCNKSCKSETFLDKIQSIEQIDNSHYKLKKAAKKLNYDLIIFGHTHKQYYKNNYLNLGSSDKEIIDEHIIKINKRIKIIYQKKNIKTNEVKEKQIYLREINK